MAAIKAISLSGFKTKVVDSTWPRQDGEGGLKKAIERICAESAQAVDDGFAFIVLSDRATSAERIPIPALLAAGGVHQHLVQSHRRTRVGLVLESGEPRYSCQSQSLRKAKFLCYTNVTRSTQPCNQIFSAI
jgi:hypothetical protein